MLYDGFHCPYSRYWSPRNRSLNEFKVNNIKNEQYLPFQLIEPAFNVARTVLLLSAITWSFPRLTIYISRPTSPFRQMKSPGEKRTGFSRRTSSLRKPASVFWKISTWNERKLRSWRLKIVFLRVSMCPNEHEWLFQLEVYRVITIILDYHRPTCGSSKDNRT